MPSHPAPGGPLEDPARLEALRRTGLLDTPPEAVFDRLTRLVCRLLGVPVALVSLVEADRQFFKSAVGLPAPWMVRRETPLSHSFCQHVVASGAPLIVQDAKGHPLVCDNLAVPDLGVVAYLGMPLTTADGHVLGSLCAIDIQPREWTPADAATLRDLAALAVSEMSLRRLASDLVDQLRREAAVREAEQARRVQAQRLEALGQLAAGMAHDFTNVLQAVQAGVNMAEAQVDRDPAVARNLLAMVTDVTRRGATVTRRLLGFAQRGEGAAAPVDAAALLRNMEQLLARTLGPSVTVRLALEPDLPWVTVDQGELEAVLVNLATNARDAMPEGGSLTFAAATDTEVTTGSTAETGGLPLGRYVRISAADTGVGMDDATLTRAAEPFFTTKPVGQGTGLGLAMARDFAEQVGGGFAVASEPGRGTTVTLWLPCVNDKSSP